jgi:hypothetical protein
LSPLLAGKVGEVHLDGLGGVVEYEGVEELVGFDVRCEELLACRFLGEV